MFSIQDSGDGRCFVVIDAKQKSGSSVQSLQEGNHRRKRGRIIVTDVSHIFSERVVSERSLPNT